jgi:hypothetical protein
VCAPISGATGASYVLAAADVGRTMRASVTASNSAGSTSASSPATATVTPLQSALTTCGGKYAPSGTPQCASGAQFIRTFESPEGLPPKWTGSNCCGPWWQIHAAEPSASGASIVSDPAGGANKVVKKTVAPQPGSYEQGYPYYSQVALVQDYPDSLAIAGKNSWYRWNQYFDPTWQGAPNTEFNWMHEFLDSPGDSHKCPGQHNYNVALGINTIGGGAKWRLQIGPAGVQTSNNCEPGGDVDIDGPNLVKGQWLHFSENINWSAHDDGRIRIWLNGTLIFDYSGPNIYQHVDGTSGFDTISWLDYRSNYSANRATTTDISYLDDIMAGPTAASIGLAP